MPNLAQSLIGAIKAGLHLLHTRLVTFGKSSFLHHGTNLHVGTGTQLWAPHHLTIGRSVYLGKQVMIAANATIGDYCLIANRVAFVGRKDHDFRQLGVPASLCRWIGDASVSAEILESEVCLGQDVWVGYGAILMTGITVGDGAVIAAGSVVTEDVPPYTIAGGVPARVLGKRFEDDQIAAHERSIREGIFHRSERGWEYFVIKPKLDQ